MENGWAHTVKSHVLLRTCGFVLSCLIMYSVSNATFAVASQSENDFVRDHFPGLHLELTEETGPTEQSSAVRWDNIDNAFFKVLPCTTIKVLFPLSHHLKLFFDLRSTLKDIYEKYDSDGKYPTLGIDILF
jgi:hypothetical protein